MGLLFQYIESPHHIGLRGLLLDSWSRVLYTTVPLASVSTSSVYFKHPSFQSSRLEGLVLFHRLTEEPTCFLFQTSLKFEIHKSHFLLNLTRAPVAGLRERAEAEMWPATVLAPSSASTASAVEGSLLRWTRPSFQCEEVGC